MTAPTFVKKRLETETDPTNLKYGAPDWTYFLDVLDGTHATDKIQASAIEHNILDFDAQVYISGTTVYARRASGVLLDSGSSTTASVVKRVIQSALTIAKTDGKATILLRHGTYPIDLRLKLYSNTTLYAYDATIDCSTFIEDTGGTTTVSIEAYHTDETTIGTQNVSIFGLTLDQGNKAKHMRFNGNDTRQVKNILIQDCTFKNPNNEATNQGWQLNVGYVLLPAGQGLPLYKNENIRVVNCLFDGTGGSDSFENIIFVNSRNVLFSNNRIFNSYKSAAAFAVFGGCENVVVSGNTFNQNTFLEGASFDMYVQQGNNIMIYGNEFGSWAQIRDTRNVSFVGNRARQMRIVDLDEPTFDSHDAFYRTSRNVLIAYNEFNNEPESPGTTMTQKLDSAVVLDFTQSDTNLAKQIAIIGNEFRTYRIMVNTTGLDDAHTDCVENLYICGNNFSGRADTGTSSLGLIRLSGNTNITGTHGFKNVFIANNYFAPKAVGSTGNPRDIDLTTTGMSNIVIMNNCFNNNGVTNINSYPNVKGNVSFAGTAATRDCNSGTATISSGTATSVTVTHGVGYTPLLENISVTPTTNLGTAAKYWVSTPTSGTFIININAGAGASSTFAWRISRD